MNIEYMIALIVGLTEVGKRVGFVDNKYAPLLAVVIGAAVGLTGGVSVENVLTGVVAGLTAAGLWDTAKSGLTAAKELK